MENKKTIQQQLDDLDTRTQKAMHDSVPMVDEARGISENQEKDRPTDDEEMNKVYQERLHIFDCLEKGEDLPEVISDKCLIQCILLFEAMMISLIQKIHKKFPPPQPKYVAVSEREYRRMLDKMSIKLLKEATPYIEQLEDMHECIKMFYEIYKEDYPEFYIRYNKNIN